MPFGVRRRRRRRGEGCRAGTNKPRSWNREGWHLAQRACCVGPSEDLSWSLGIAGARRAKPLSLSGALGLSPGLRGTALQAPPDSLRCPLLDHESRWVSRPLPDLWLLFPWHHGLAQPWCPWAPGCPAHSLKLHLGLPWPLCPAGISGKGRSLPGPSPALLQGLPLEQL